MKKTVSSMVIILLVTLITCCGPSKKYVMDPDTLEAIAREGATIDWKKTLQETDDCSAPGVLTWFVESSKIKNWQDCCYQHDFDYNRGHKYGISRDEADYYLWECVDASGHRYIANIIYRAVWMLGGFSYKKGAEDD